MKHHKIKPIRFRLLRRKPRKSTILKKEFRVRKPGTTLAKDKWDKSKLIPVQKTIQGETGPYTAIRYCSQGEAKSELNSALVRKYGNDVKYVKFEIKYVKFEIKHGKHKGKQISVDQAIKLCPSYTKEESKKAKNPVALKDFIKNNFKAVITKPEENEEEPKTDNENRSKTSQKEKKPKKKQEKVDGIDDSRYNKNKGLKKSYRKRYQKDKKLLKSAIKKEKISEEESAIIFDKLSKDMAWNKNVDSEFHGTINAGIKEQTCMHLIGGHPNDMIKDWPSVKKVFEDPDEILEQKDKDHGRKSYIHLREDTDMIVVVEEIDNMSYKTHLKSAFIPDDGMEYVERKVKSMQPVWKKGEDENDQDKET